MKRYLAVLPVIMLLMACNGSASKNTETPEPENTETTVSEETPTTESKEVIVGTTKINVSIASKEDNGQGHPESKIIVLADGKEVLQKTLTNTSGFLEAASFQQTNPIPADNAILLAVGGEYAETGHFIYPKKEGEKVIVREITSDAVDAKKSTVIKEIPLAK